MNTVPPEEGRRIPSGGDDPVLLQVAVAGPFLCG
jgi:hypothetical protein